VTPELMTVARSAKGFLLEEEGVRLHELAREASRAAPCVEIGSYCGKSALFIGAGCREAGAHPLFTVDHHRGSVGQQPGEAYFDPELYDEDEGVFTTLDELVRNVRRAGLEEWVIPVVGDSRVVGRQWQERSLGLVFVDGGHSHEDAFGDYRTWGRCVRAGGYLCVHDVFPDPADGGRAPYDVVCEARRSGDWDELEGVGSLAILRRR
jgi:predicted O-methyltransferase YrrM